MHWYWQVLAWHRYASISKIYTRVMALGLCLNFISAQYLEQIEFHQILDMHWKWQDLAWDRSASFSTNSYQSYGPWFNPTFCFAQYLENKLTEFHQILNMHSYSQDLVCYRVMAHYWCQNVYLINIFRFSCEISIELGLFTAWKALQWGYSQNLWQF